MHKFSSYACTCAVDAIRNCTFVTIVVCKYGGVKYTCTMEAVCFMETSTDCSTTVPTVLINCGMIVVCKYMYINRS